jgi:DNA-binding response OmpR family regulator
VSDLLAGLRVLLLEDEFLIAMDLEQLCRDHGAEDVIVIRSLNELDADRAPPAGVGVAIVDVMLGGEQTLDFAEGLHAAGVPFVFASGFSQLDDMDERFPGVKLIGKPYSGPELIRAVADACGRSVTSGST